MHDLEQKHKEVAAEYNYAMALSDLLQHYRSWLSLAFNALNKILGNTAYLGTKTKPGVYSVGFGKYL